MNDERSQEGVRAAPYADLTPASVLDALDGVGLRGDGRMLQLNSYENRVFQAFLEDGRVVVAKFYRPGRWTDAQILEEHAFTAELATAEIPVAAPLALAADAASPYAAAIAAAGPTLAIAAIGSQAYRFGVCERRDPRRPRVSVATSVALRVSPSRRPRCRHRWHPRRGPRAPRSDSAR